MSAIPKAPTLSSFDRGRLEREGGVEFVTGKLLEKPVSVESSRVEAIISRMLGNEAARSAKAEVFGSTMGYRCFPDDPLRFRKPDVSVVHTDRLVGIDPEECFMPAPPDLAVEVISPGDLAYDMAQKIEEYLKNGFRLIWIVYPNTKTVAIHRADGSVSHLHEQDEITGESALPTFRCKVAEFFAHPT
jgi:Uma2 family endonuclease